MYCPICGNEVDPKEAFCSECGNRLTAGQEQMNAFGNGWGQQPKDGIYQGGYAPYPPNMNYGYARPVYIRKRRAHPVLVIFVVIILLFAALMGIGIYYKATHLVEMDGFTVELPLPMKENTSTSNLDLDDVTNAKFVSYADIKREFVYVKYDYSVDEFASMKYLSAEQIRELFEKEFSSSFPNYEQESSQGERLSFCFTNLSDKKILCRSRILKTKKGFYLLAAMCEEEKQDLYGDDLTDMLDSVKVN